MGNVLHRVTKDFLKSVNTPDFPSGTYAINPAGTAGLEGGSVPTKYWKLTGTHPAETAVEMDAGEKESVDDSAPVLAATKAARYVLIDGKTQDIIDEGFVHAAQTFGMSTGEITNFEAWREKIRAGTDTYPKDWVLKDLTVYSVTDRVDFLRMYHTCLEASEAAHTSALIFRSDIAAATTDAAVDAVVDGRAVTAYTPGGTPARGPFVLTGSQDLTAGVPFDLSITGAKDVCRIARARFWTSENGFDVGVNVATRIMLEFYTTAGFVFAELDTTGKAGLREQFQEFQFVSQDLAVGPNNGAGTIDIDNMAKFGLDDLIRIHDGTNHEFQRVKAKIAPNTLDLHNTILKAGTPAWAVDDDVSRVLEIRDLTYNDEDRSDKIHLRMTPRAGDSDCRLHYWIEFEGAK